MRAGVLVLAPLVVCLAASSSRADAVSVRPQNEGELEIENQAPDATPDWLVNRKHTLAELEAGIIALPNAPISSGQQGGQTPLGTIGHGDATLEIGTHLLYRGGRDWAVGAGALFAPSPTSDNHYGGATGLSRSHARSYLWLGTEARYIPIHWRWFEGWVGVTAGVVVVADRFTTNAGDDVPAILGSKEVTVRTEGGGFGGMIGGDWLFAERFVAGFTTRFDHWILPSAPQCTSLGDCATLGGPVEAFEIGLHLGYRLPL